MSKKLWEEYLETKTTKSRNALIVEYIPYVHYLVGNSTINSLPDGITIDDLIQYGICGLIKAVETYDPSKGAKFETWGAWKIKGQVKDQLRKHQKLNGGLTRTSWMKVKRIEEAIKKLEARLKRHPSTEEIAEELGVTMREYEKLLSCISKGTQLSLDSLVGSEHNLSLSEVVKDEKSLNPEEECLNKESIELLSKEIESLPPNEWMIVNLYYYEKMTLKEIGEVLGLKESRISQLHSQCIIRLRNKLVGGT